MARDFLQISYRQADLKFHGGYRGHGRAVLRLGLGALTSVSIYQFCGILF